MEWTNCSNETTYFMSKINSFGSECGTALVRDPHAFLTVGNGNIGILYLFLVGDFSHNSKLI